MVTNSRPLEVKFGPITPENIDKLRRINAAAFPVQYTESFYQDILKRNNDNLNKFAYHNGVVVGAICARIDQPGNSCSIKCHGQDRGLRKTKGAHQRLYIMTLAVIAAYRGRQIGSQLLESVLRFCRNLPKLDAVSLHVQTSNKDAIRFYTDRFGFELGEIVENYYRRMDPPHSYILFKIVKEDDSEDDPIEREDARPGKVRV